LEAKGSASLPVPLRRHRQLLDARVEELAASVGDGPLGDGIASALSGGGKRLRPLLGMWLGHHLGVEERASLPICLSVELLHNAFLIHDDIQDGDRWRRDRPTLWVSHGLPMALNVADWLLARTYSGLASPGIPDSCRHQLLEAFTTTHAITVEGQALDIAWRADPRFDLDRYDQIIRAKTGRYLALGLVGVALAGASNAGMIDALWQVGDLIGPAFQIQDDLLDLTVGKGRGGEVGCDIREGKPSILVAHALTRSSLSAGESSRLIEVLAKPREETQDLEVAWVITLFERVGSLDFARKEASQRIQAGIDCFMAATGLPAAGEFVDIARFVIEREA